jgi:hypothetical protein
VLVPDIRYARTTDGVHIAYEVVDSIAVNIGARAGGVAGPSEVISDRGHLYGVVP